MPILNEPICTEIIPQLWLGNYLSSHNEKFIKNNNIKYIVNVTHNYPNLYKNIKYIRIPVRNSVIKSHKILKKNFNYINNFINNGLKKGSVLVHCKSGHRRSATVVANYLMNKFNITVDEAIKIIKNKRPTVFPPKTYIKNTLY